MAGDAVLRDVSDTARLVAAHRALEAERPDALFADPYARRLAGERGDRMLREIRFGRVNWPVVVRTHLIDQLILRAVQQEGTACVLNLAAGLDSRPYRLDLPSELRWLEVDLPGILDYKAELLDGERPRCRLERLACDLTDQTARLHLLQELPDLPTLVLTEGLLAYLAGDDVAALGKDLSGRPQLRWWLMDLPGPLFVQWGNRGGVGRHLAQANTPFRFGPEEGPGFFRPLGWEPVEVSSLWLDARRLRREPSLMRLLWILGPARQRERYRKFQLTVLLAATR